jgi:N-methylhydantoinase B
MYSCDRFTAAVLLNRLRYTVEHMAAGFLRQSFSPIIRDWYDFACTISGPRELNYPMGVVSNSLISFVGSMADGVANSVQEFGSSNLGPGDVLICNDPYRSGTHVNDLCFIRPVFVDGRIVAFVNLRAHQLDMGGTVPGGFSATKTNVYDNGLVLPPMLLWRGDEAVRSSFSLVADNTRFAAQLIPDFWSVYRQLLLGERLVLENAARYVVEALAGTLRYACDSSAERMREAIASIPDGDYRGRALIDADGLDDTVDYHVCVTLRKRGHDIEADLSGTSRQARTCINAGVLEAKTAVGAALTMLLDPSIPFTSGTWRRIDVAVPPGTVLSALPPNGPTMMYWEVMAALMTAVFTALNPALEERGIAGDFGSSSVHNAHGLRQDGSTWTNICLVGGEHGPWGATSAGDADSYTVPYKDNNLDPAIEQIEHDSPCVVLRREHAIDTGGPGLHRGGAANRKDTLFLTAGNHYSSPFRFREPSGVGANGGWTGAAGAVWLFPPSESAPRPKGLLGTTPADFEDSTPVAGVLDPATKTLNRENGVYHHFASRQVWITGPGSVFRYQTNAGGGWGDPFSRDTLHVLADVRDEYVSIEGAARDYGVVVMGDPVNDPEGLVVDEVATARLRRQA